MPLLRRNLVAQNDLQFEVCRIFLQNDIVSCGDLVTTHHRELKVHVLFPFKSVIGC